MHIGKDFWSLKTEIWILRETFPVLFYVNSGIFIA